LHNGKYRYILWNNVECFNCTLVNIDIFCGIILNIFNCTAVNIEVFCGILLLIIHIYPGVNIETLCETLLNIIVHKGNIEEFCEIMLHIHVRTVVNIIVLILLIMLRRAYFLPYLIVQECSTIY